MKRTIRLMVLAAMAVGMAFASCQKEDSNSNGGNTNSGNSNGGDTENEEWVDLGLPSGLLWASCNVGAAAPEEYGDYYAWGETETKNNFDWSTYQHCNGAQYLLTKYNADTNYGTADNLTTLEAIDDVATQSLGNGARIPTKAEWEELMDYTTAEWTTVNNINGRRFTAANGKSIFLPAAGYHSGSELIFDGSYGHYWSSSLSATPSRAWYIYFSQGYHQGMDSNPRDNGLSVRPVRSAHSAH